MAHSDLELKILQKKERMSSSYQEHVVKNEPVDDSGIDSDMKDDETKNTQDINLKWGERRKEGVEVR